jgi:hypothetical protein
MYENYEFRKRLLETHEQNRKSLNITPTLNELLIDDEWTILIDNLADRIILNAAKDLQEYLFTSMGVSVRLKKACSLNADFALIERKIVLTTKDGLCNIEVAGNTPKSYRIISANDSITICGYDERGTAQGCYYLEDLMNFRSAPIVKKEDVIRKPLFSPRMVHSGYGLDLFPDTYLNTIAHSGMDAILLFVKDVNITPHGYVDFNELIYRAAGYGIDVYAYSYLKSLKHPDDPDAEEYYNQTYGNLFKECPGFKGIVMVGESVEFPSKDKNTSGKPYYDNTEDGLPTGKPSAGWWPCYDYPQWLEMIKKVTRQYKPDADIVFWTYNWGYVDKELRIELLKKIPTDISLLVTFEMFEKIRHENITSECVDYTLSFEGPGEYFASEAEIAHDRGIRLYTMSNTGGLTWDIGVIPYEPAPYQWIRRFKALHAAKEKWGLSGLMESHHYGWWPSFISEIAKWSYWTPSPSSEEICRMIAIRDFGEENLEMVLDGWKAWSEGITHYISTDEDQYGPFRVGPSYPLVFRSYNFVDNRSGNVIFPKVPYSMFGANAICDVSYDTKDLYRSSLFQCRLPVEIRSLRKMKECFSYGVKCFEKVYTELPEYRRKKMFYMLNLGKFITHSVDTVINVKEWSILKAKLSVETDKDNIMSILDSMMDIGKKEIRNAEETIPLVEADSRLGWEPSMEYITDAYHLRWKIRQVKDVVEVQIPAYCSALKYNSQS